MKKILFVDDEIQILKSLIRLFMDSEYEVFTAEGGEEALKILDTEDISLVISDMRMPIMDGYELLSKVKELHPNVMRVILSGYSDEKVVFKALQKNIAKLYMFKPWENEALLNVIEKIFETQDTLKQSNLMLLINNIENLPTIKVNYQRILQLIESDVNIQQIATEIERDVAIATKILHVANSAYFGAKTGSISQAVNYIGLQNTKNLILATSVIDSMSGAGASSEIIEGIWKHSFISNRLLSFLYEKHLNKKLPETFASAGLLQNIGEVFFLKYYREKYLKLLLKARNEKKDIEVLEREMFNTTHNEAGGYLLQWWEFPYPIVEAALYHHNPIDEKVINQELTCALHIVEVYANKFMKKEWYGGFDIRAFEFLHISKADFEASLNAFKV